MLGKKRTWNTRVQELEEVSRETDERRDSVAERGRESRRRSGEEG